MAIGERKKRILVACHSAAATSTYAAEKIRELLDKQGLEGEVQISTLSELPGWIESFKPDLVLTTSQVYENLNIPKGTPVVSGLAYLTGLGVDDLEARILEALSHEG